MAVHGFNHYNLRAPRELLDTLRDFYCSVVGLTQGDRPAFRSFGYWLYAGGRDLLHLSETHADEVRATHVATTFDHVAFTCSDFAATEAHLTRHGVNYRVSDVPATGQRQIFFHDPAGNGVEFNFPL
ncbi:glyoxalase-like domain protein [mine drainage metagenome]|uniref:Glyoxalase-like domain protein n=1 Tax=mine drainage metagenome TaxID=410659 RepID=A0A1J5QTP2_9ZZZZ